MIYFFVILVLLLICVAVIGAISDFTLALLVYIFNHPIIIIVIFTLIFVIFVRKISINRWEKMIKEMAEADNQYFTCLKEGKSYSKKVYIHHLHEIFGYRVFRCSGDIFAVRNENVVGSDKVEYRERFFIDNRPFYYKGTKVERYIYTLLFGKYDYTGCFSKEVKDEDLYIKFYDANTKKEIIHEELPGFDYYSFRTSGGFKSSEWKKNNDKQK